MDILTKDEAKGKMVRAGEIVGDTFYKKVEYSKHFMRVVSGYGIQQNVFEQLVKRGIAKVQIEEVDTGALWGSRLNDWVEHGKSANYGHGKQRFLSLKYYSVLNTPKAVANEVAPPKDDQMGLF